MNKPKLCIDCRSCEILNATPVCNNEYCADVVEGMMRHSCAYARSSDGACGKDGKYWGSINTIELDRTEHEELDNKLAEIIKKKLNYIGPSCSNEQVAITNSIDKSAPCVYFVSKDGFHGFCGAGPTACNLRYGQQHACVKYMPYPGAIKE